MTRSSPAPCQVISRAPAPLRAVSRKLRHPSTTRHLGALESRSPSVGHRKLGPPVPAPQAPAREPPEGGRPEGRAGGDNRSGSQRKPAPGRPGGLGPCQYKDKWPQPQRSRGCACAEKESYGVTRIQGVLGLCSRLVSPTPLAAGEASGWGPAQDRPGRSAPSAGGRSGCPPNRTRAAATFGRDVRACDPSERLPLGIIARATDSNRIEGAS